ncbi:MULTISPECIES: putative leader peptide [Streptomyces]
MDAGDAGRQDLTRRRHVDLARVSSAVCRATR